ncbi:NAD(P)H-quinone oxidoreductase subunit F [Acaryochloris marina]|uniref:NAD(P)H dehydrogenase, subunit NdhF3 family n=1 Tax=Acaryochloris marina (strain MBIC 11017) TaxID=329726 RepID=B0C8P1_ACAM1|nr:NAD(P)H-quinone oxidoreductase subunit F [Acaryochloris marina]ABW31303.1 NAD(P)H dehydrogenase, subunit NdhF3 family [Acaryochloris marina MBIC11017]
MLQFLIQTAWFIPCYPLIGMVISLLWTPSIIRRTGPRPAGYVNIVTTFCAFLHGVITFPSFWNQPPQYINITWLEVSGLTLDIPLEISSITLGAGIVITSLNLLTQFYAIGYLEMDWGWARFFALLALFETGMCSLALCNSLFFSYIILEILTLATYLIVGTWFNQSLVVTGARDAFLTKRVGDLFLLMGVLAIFPLAGTWDYREMAIWAQTAQVNPTVMTWLGLGLVAGPMGKCAQFPLHLWLDEAMEGPVPGTILRNSVVVSTGAWVILKLSPVISLSPIALTTMIAVGAITAIGGTLIAIAQIDIKRALSYSASVYMGLIFIAVGTQQLNAALLLMLTYALSMSLLIMSTGSIILNTITQDLTQMGGLWSRRPISGLSYLVGTVGLVALPPFGTFWALLELIDGLWTQHPVLVGVVLLVNALTGFSIIREFGLIFAGERQQMTVRSPENLWSITLPTTILAGATLHLPIILQKLELLPHWSVLNHEAGFLLAASSLVGCGLGALIYVGNRFSKPVRLPWTSVQDFFAFDMYTPTLYRSSIVSGVDGISRLTDWLDRKVVDGVVNWIARTSVTTGEVLKYGNIGQTQFYLLTIITGVFVITLLLLRSLL